MAGNICGGGRTTQRMKEPGQNTDASICHVNVSSEVIAPRFSFSSASASPLYALLPLSAVSWHQGLALARFSAQQKFVLFGIPGPRRSPAPAPPFHHFSGRGGDARGSRPT